MAVFCIIPGLPRISRGIGYDIDTIAFFFRQVFDSLLAELEPVCTSEQEFVEKFFDLYTEEAEVCDRICEHRLFSLTRPTECFPLVPRSTSWLRTFLCQA